MAGRRGGGSTGPARLCRPTDVQLHSTSSGDRGQACVCSLPITHCSLHQTQVPCQWGGSKPQLSTAGRGGAGRGGAAQPGALDSSSHERLGPHHESLRTVAASCCSASLGLSCCPAHRDNRRDRGHPGVTSQAMLPFQWSTW